MQTNPNLNEAVFYGTDITQNDITRLGGQLKAVFDLMIDGRRRSTYAIGEALAIPAASAHRHLSTLRTQYGFTVEKELIGEGLWLYQIIGRGDNTRKPKKTKPIGDPELCNKMLQAMYIFAHDPNQDLVAREQLNRAVDKWVNDMVRRVK